MSDFSALFTIVPVVIGVVVVLIVVMIVVNVIRVRKAGHNPLTLQADLATRVLDSDLLKAAPTKADQLREIDALHTSGQITAAEKQAARDAVLRGSGPA